MNKLTNLKNNFIPLAASKRIFSRRLLSSTLVLFALLSTQQAFADVKPAATQPSERNTAVSQKIVDQSNPYNMVKDAAKYTFKRFANEQQLIRENPNLLKDIVREELMPYVDYVYSAFKVIGPSLSKTTDEDRRDFVEAFQEYLVTSYAQVFTLYDNQTVEYAPAKPFEGKGILAVDTRIIMPGSDNIDVAFKVRLNKKTKKWYAFDMVAEGVSLLDSKQAELGGIIRQKGLPYATELLKEKSARDIVFKDGKQKADTPLGKQLQKGSREQN